MKLLYYLRTAENLLFVYATRRFLFVIIPVNCEKSGKKNCNIFFLFHLCFVHNLDHQIDYLSPELINNTTQHS